MGLSFHVTKLEVITVAVGFALTCLLAVLPPLEVAGLPLYFYLTPALMISYFVPVWLYAIGLLCAVFFGVLVVGGMTIAAGPESLVSGILLMSLILLRNLTSRADTIFITVLLLCVMAFPLSAFLNFYWSGYALPQATLLASNYVVACLVSLLLAEVFVIIIALSDWRVLSVLRKTLNFRPSLVQVIEVIVTIAVAASLTVTLVMFWRDGDASLKSQVRTAANARLAPVYASAEATMIERLTQVSAATASMREIGIESKIIPGMGRLLSHDLAPNWADFERPLDYAVIFDDDLTFATLGLPVEVVTKAIAFASAQSTSKNTLRAMDVRLPDGQKYPVSVLLGQNGKPSILVLYHSLNDALLFQFGLARLGYREMYGDTLSLATLNATDTLGQFGVPSDAQILSQPNFDQINWLPASSELTQRGRVFVSRATVDTYLTLTPSSEYITRFSHTLHGVESFRITLPYWPYFIDFSEAVTFSVMVTFASLMVLLLGARIIFGRLVSPLAELARMFESWRHFRNGELNSSSALQALDFRGLSSLSDIHALQTGFRSLAQNVTYGERRLSTIAANYDALLRSLPLGVLAIDGSSQITFLNDAIGDIIGQGQDAAVRLAAKASDMLSTGVSVQEWQLTLEDSPPKNLLLVVNLRLDDRGRESGLWVIATDLTGQKQTSAQLIQAAKLATLGEMSTGMAHELNQPLNVISLASSNLRFSIKKDKATSEKTLLKLDRIDSAVQRAASIIDHMRAYGRLAGENLAEINVGEVCIGACNLLEQQLKLVNIALVNGVPDAGLQVTGNAIQLEQVLINLINNAKDAIKDGGSEGVIKLDAELSGDMVLLKVTDSGGGIPNHVLPHIFEPFFTTKPVGKGTGLGGSISYGIVREMHGDIWAENVSGGAQITISLPLAGQELSTK
ncbi:ATP-binding protein [bacterium]|nr:ATP-binding protein [bacterium]